MVTSAFRWESGRLLARWLLARSENSTKHLKNKIIEGIEIITKPNPVLSIVFTVSVIVNIVNTEIVGFFSLDIGGEAITKV